jgi:hypothetical protein
MENLAVVVGATDSVAERRITQPDFVTTTLAGPPPCLPRARRWWEAQGAPTTVG